MSHSVGTLRGSRSFMLHYIIKNTGFVLSRETDFEGSTATYERHFHTRYEMLYFIGGNLKYNIDGTVYDLAPHDLIIIPPSTYHFVSEIVSYPYERLVFHFDSSFECAELLEVSLEKSITVNIENDSRLRRMFSTLDYYNETYTEKDRDRAAKLLASEIIMYCAYMYKTSTVEPYHGDELISKITSIVSSELTGELTSEIIAKRLKFSKSYIQNRFSKIMGIGLKQYINQKKLHAASNDIKAGIPPFEAARKYGFGDYSAFYRLYKKTFGVSPRKSGKADT